MAEYIEREAAVQCSRDVARDFENDGEVDASNGAYTVGDWLAAIPAADVRPVVLCRDCKYNCGAKTWIDHEITADCTNGHGYPPLDWFCADGVKREGS